LLLGTSLAVLAACSGGEDPRLLPDHTLGPETTTTTRPVYEDLEGIPVLAEVAHPPGSPLGDGLVTPPGTNLLGDTLPVGPEESIDGEPVDDDGWRALFVVTGDPAAALADLEAQYGAVGAAHPDWELRLFCIRQAPEPLAPLPTSELLVHLRKPTIGGSAGVRRFVTGETAPLPGGFAQPAVPGGRLGFDDDADDPVLHALTVPEGTFEVVPAFAALTTSRNIGYQTLLRIDGEPEAVADDLSAQIRRFGYPVEVEQRRDDGVDVTRLTSDDPAYYSIEVVDGGPGHRWASVVTDPGD
jgi:hypothetical protein